MEAKIREVLAQHAELSQDVTRLDAGADLYAAGMTSFASVNVMLALEDAFGIEFPEAMLKRSVFASINSIEAAVEQLVGVAAI